jgi:hypothetical protein
VDGTICMHGGGTWVVAQLKGQGAEKIDGRKDRRTVGRKEEQRAEVQTGSLVCRYVGRNVYMCVGG